VSKASVCDEGRDFDTVATAEVDLQDC